MEGRAGDGRGAALKSLFLAVETWVVARDPIAARRACKLSRSDCHERGALPGSAGVP
jgi:hypothetical protein